MKDKNPKNTLDRKTLNRRTMLRTTAVGAGALSLVTVLPDPASKVIATESRSHSSLKTTDYELINVKAPSGVKWALCV